MNRSIYLFPLCVCAVFSFSGCGGSDSGSSGVASYSGSQVQASLSTDNSEALSRGATEGAINATSGSGLSSMPGGFSSSSSYEYAGTIVKELLVDALADITGSSAVSAYQEEQPCIVSGSILIAADDSLANETNEDFPESGSMTMDFRDCKQDDTTTVNGIATTTFTGGGSFTTVYQDFTIAYAGLGGEQVVETIENLAITCTEVTGTFDCSVQADFVGVNGLTYRISDVSASGSDSFGWSVSANVYHPDYGYVEIDTTTALVLDCPTRVPSSGALTISGTNGDSASITYLDCSTFQVCLLGGSVCNTYNW